MLPRTRYIGGMLLGCWLMLVGFSGSITKVSANQPVGTHSQVTFLSNQTIYPPSSSPDGGGNGHQPNGEPSSHNDHNTPIQENHFPEVTATPVLGNLPNTGMLAAGTVLVTIGGAIAVLLLLLWQAPRGELEEEMRR